MFLYHSYCVHAVDLMVMDSYEVVFFNSAMDGANIPSRQWIKKCYDMVQYRYVCKVAKCSSNFLLKLEEIIKF